jgi:hypothetical protein
MPMTHNEPEPRSPIQLHAIVAAEAFVDVRTVDRALRGDRVRTLSRERIRLALEAKGWGHLLPARGTR